MADNYLERKMEDLRSGKLSSNPSSCTSGPRRGFLSFRFPLRRVLIVDLGEPQLTVLIAEAFSDHGCKTAVLYNSYKQNFDLGGKARTYGIDGFRYDYACKRFRELANEWHDVDIVIFCGDFLPYMFNTSKLIYEWIDFRSTLPYPNDYGGRIIYITPKYFGPPLFREHLESLYSLDIGFHAINAYEEQENPDVDRRRMHTDPDRLRDIVNLTLFIASPAGEALRHNIVNVY